MRIHQINAHFWAVLSYGAGSNKFVLTSSDFNVLIDPGMTRDASKLCSLLRKHIGLNPTNIDVIILTHAHADHAGAVPYLKEQSSADLYVHQEELSPNYHNLSFLQRTIFKKTFQPIYVEKKLKEGDLIQSPNDEFVWTVLHTPGHSPGSICLYNEKEKMLITGDTIFEGGDIGRVDLPGGNLDDLITSVTRINQLDVNSFFPGHKAIVLGHTSEHIPKSLKLAQSLLNHPQFQDIEEKKT